MMEMFLEGGRMNRRKVLSILAWLSSSLLVFAACEPGSIRVPDGGPHCRSASDCDDNDICTDDACDPASGCRNTNACDPHATCQGGTCVCLPGYSGDGFACVPACGDGQCASSAFTSFLPRPGAGAGAWCWCHPTRYAPI